MHSANKKNIPQILNSDIDRRDLLKKITNFGITFAGLPLINGLAWGAVPNSDKSINIYNTHTGESLKKARFWSDGKLNLDVMNEIKHLFRDHRTNKSSDIDSNLIHLLHDIADKTGSSAETIHLISGYRSPKTNAYLHQNNKGVASNSQHLYGKAADIMIPGRSMRQIQQAARSLRAGGVGRYSRFVHVDTGRVRYWGSA